jgi:glutamyl-Q tRNA(Asp) synthetase
VIVTRFAPSPTGYLHLGHAYSALIAWRAAREAGGRFLLRIEDIDTTRCRPEFTAAILEDLAWLGIDWDGDVREQSEYFADYEAALDKLDVLGVLYPCFCSRAEIARASAAPQGEEVLRYPGTCRSISTEERVHRIAAGESFGLRLDVARALARRAPLEWEEDGRGMIAAEPERLGDVVVARKDAPTSYHLAVTVDDALQGVTLVTRGADLFMSTHIHRLLQALLDLPVPRYRHHRLLTDAQGKRFAKRDRALTLRALRDAGRTAAEVRAMAEQTGAD